MIIASGCSTTGVTPMGDGMYMIAKTGGTPGASGAEVSADLYREAYAFCASKNMDFHKVSIDEKDWKAFVRLASSKLEFRCVENPENN